MNNENFTKRGHGSYFFMKGVRIIVIIDFIAIFQTAGIFLIQIVNTNNTYMYLIHFHIKNNI